MADITNELFEAIYTIVTGVVSKQNYDITKEGRIIEAYTDNNTGALTGIYKVKFQDAIFDAYAQNGAIYAVDQQVYVQIPNGDYDSQKFIIGKKVDLDNENDIYNLKMPFDDFCGLYNLSQNTPMDDVGYWANCPFHGSETTLTLPSGEVFPYSGDHMWHWENIEKRPIYATRLGLEIDVTTLLHAYRPSSGSYGLRIEVKGCGTEELESSATQEISQEYWFKNTQMYGNPYAYTLGSTQQLVVDISKFNRAIDSIDIWFWQDHNFRDEFNEPIPYGEIDVEPIYQEMNDAIKAIRDDENLNNADKEIKLLEISTTYSEKLNKVFEQSAELKNIKFSNLKLLLGLSVSEMQEETATLYTYDVTQYGEDENNAEVRQPERTLYLAWAHKQNNSLMLIDTYNQIEELGAKVYWYNYDPEWTAENEEYDEENYSHKLGGNYWKPYPVLENPQLKEDTPISFTVVPNKDKAKERYKAVIHYDGAYITSNVFIFQNCNKSIESDRANLARNDRIILRCATLSEDTKYLQEDDSIGNFFVYNENNNVLTNDNNILFSDVRYYIEPWINDLNTDSDYPIYRRLSEYTDIDGNYLNYHITWQFPESFTMIKSWGLLDNSAKDSQYWNNRSDFLFERDIATTRYFQIDPIHNVRYNDNTMSAIIDIEGMGTFQIKKDLIFGRAEAFGCEFTPVITINKPAGNFYVDTNSDFELQCLVYDRKGKLMSAEDRVNCQFLWKIYGTRYKPKDSFPHENYAGFFGNVFKGHITQPYPFIVEVTVTGAAEYDITVRRGIMVSNNTQFMQNYDIVCPNRVEFRSDGQAPIFASNPFEVQRIITDTLTSEDGEKIDCQNELIYPEWGINNDYILSLVRTEYNYPIFVLPDGTQTTKQNVDIYSLAFSANLLNTNIANESPYGQQWTEDLLDEKYFTYIYFEYENVRVAQAIAFAQNLYPSSLVNEWDGQSLSLDEENSAILAKMIAAGTKDQRNRFTGVMMGDWHEKGDESLDTPGIYGFNAGQQSFGFKTDGTGFIGPSGEGRIQFDGRNALISNSTQTCYLNLNPRRVQNYLSFDGTGYVINNQAWDSIGNQSISQYFLYAQTPRRVSTFAQDNEDGNPVWTTAWDQHTDAIWANPFMNDNEHDYFIVDPNYGVITTGGIFARYGRLGKDYPWIISDYGLTQKNKYGRIFLGNPEKNLSTGYLIPNPTFTMFDENNNEYEESVENNFFSASFSNNRNQIQTGIRADGYFYTKYATVGNWYVNDYEIYCVSDGDTFRKSYNAGEHLKDAININSKKKFISFNNGKLVIDGEYGWMGFSKENNGIELVQTPSYYNMLIDFNTGNMGFGKYTDNTIPYSQINGNDGSAYFSNGQIQIDGDTATIYCGVSSEYPGAFPDMTTEDIVTGTIYLAGVELQGTTPKENTTTNYIIPDLLNKGTAQDVDSGEPQSTDYNNYNNKIILPFNLGDYVAIGNGSENEEITEPNGDYVYLTTFTGQYYLSSIETASTTHTIGGLGSATMCVNGKEIDSGTIQFLFGESNVAITPQNTNGYLINWDYIGNYAVINNLLQAQQIKSSIIYMLDDSYGSGTPKYAVVATQPWVMEILENDVWPKIRSVNNLASVALEKANEAITLANKGITLANKALTEIKKKAIQSVNLRDDIIVGGFTGLDVTWTTLEGTQEQAGRNIVVTNVNHSHYQNSINVNAGTLSVTIGPASSESSRTSDEVTIFESNGFTLSESNGTITGSVTVANRTSTANFNMADTIFFKQRAYKSVSKGSGGTTVNFAMDADWSGDSRLGLSRAIDLNIIAQDDSILQTIHVATSGTGAYDVGYNAGWKAAAAEFKRSGNTVYGPSDTVGSTESYTASASGGTHNTGFNYDSSTSIKAGTWTHSDGTTKKFSGTHTWYRGISVYCKGSNASISWNR